MSAPDTRAGAIAWMARNPVAANFLLLIVIALGVKALFELRKETFPSVDFETIRVTVPYPGSSPSEVEEGILLRIEEAVLDLENIKELRAEAREGIGVINVIMQPRSDMIQALNEVSSRVNGIASFPAEAEKPVVEKLLSAQHVINLSVYGQLTERQLKQLADRARDDLLSLGGITQVRVTGVRDYEIAIELSDTQLRQYGLSFDRVVQLIRERSRNLPGGNLRTEAGRITLRSQGQAYSGAEFEDLVLIAQPDGTRLRLGDVASVRDGFVDKPVLARFNGDPMAKLQVLVVGDQNTLKISESVQTYAESLQTELPPGVHVAVWNDAAEILRGRIGLMVKNAVQGGILVLLVLALFLRLQLALWVVIGVPFCFFGAFWVMSWTGIDVSINVLSVFGFILVLGIVVDDAIVTGESAYSTLEREKQGLDSIIRGVHRVAVPTIFGVLTTVIAFIPMLGMESGMGRFMEHIAVVVMACLVFSIIETKLILPAHLAHIGAEPPAESGFGRAQAKAAAGLQFVITRLYQPLLQVALRQRYLTLSIFVAIFILMLSLMPAGIVRFVFFPNIPSNQIQVGIELPDDAPWQRTHDYALHIERAAETLNRRYRESTGEALDALVMLETISLEDNSATITAQLVEASERSISSVTMAGWWREAIGVLPGLKSMSMDSTAGPDGADLEFRLVGKNLDNMRAAASEIGAVLADYPGVYDVRNTFGEGAPELDIRLLPAGESLGLGQAEVARQVRQAFFGAEVQRVQRGRHEVRVYVRLPRQQRDTVATLESLWLRLADGTEVPFSAVAEAHPGTGVALIRRQNRERAVNIMADLDKTRVEPDAVLARFTGIELPQILQRYPGVRFEFAGMVEQQRSENQNLLNGAVVVLLMIYAALAIPLRSYGQPLFIMSAIPFAILGAIAGHWIMGMAVNFFSLVGMVALAGIVVNDSLVLVDYINREIREGKAAALAIADAGVQRFRAVILTSLTTFVGLFPLQMETSIQAQFLKPMALSVGFGVLFATFITLLLVPCLMAIKLDLPGSRRPASEL